MALSVQKRRERQRKLLDVAENLIRTGHDAAGFSMTQLATAAGVSPATPYNLLGTKADILKAIVHNEFERFNARLSALAETDPLQRLRRATEAVVGHYAADPCFYVGLFRAASSPQSSVVGTMLSVEGHILWEDLMNKALSSGQLVQWLHIAPATEVLMRTLYTTTQLWLGRGWPLERYADEMTHAVSTLLLGYAAPVERDALAADVEAAQARVAQWIRSDG